MRRALLTSALALAATAAALLPGAATAAPGPAFSLTVAPNPANLAPGKNVVLFALATNVGAAPTAGPVTIAATMPAGMTPLAHEGCTISGQQISCQRLEPILPGGHFALRVTATVSAAAEGQAVVPFTVSGGGAEEQSFTTRAPFQSGAVPFSIIPPGLVAPLSEEDGSPATLAGSHPYQQTVAFQFPTYKPPSELPNGEISNSGHPHEIRLQLPAGLVGDPAASPVLCTETQLYTETCPSAAAVGLVEVTTIVGSAELSTITHNSLYAMVPPPGHPAEFGANIAGVGIYTHLFASVRSDGDYGVEVATPDVLAFGTQPIFGINAQVWGDPSAPVHAPQRGESCAKLSETEAETSCPVLAQPEALLTLPSHCPGTPIATAVAADSWEQIGSFVESSYQSADLSGGPVSVTGCTAPGFSPTIEARPTTNLADSPSGLDVDLRLPVDMDKERRSPPPLRNATVTLPQGMAINPSQADGLAACSQTEIGYLGPAQAEGEGPRFSRGPQSCPEASKLGSVEVTSPLIVRRDEDHQLEVDPESHLPIPRPLSGSLYLAEPYRNPFGSLLAIYLTVEDPETGIVAKLAGRVIPDPQTGQLTTVFEENPQLPLEEIRLSLFEGSRAPLTTPLICGTHMTTTTLTPWSFPETAAAHPQSSFQTTGEPGGSSCPTSEAAASNSRGFSAGTLSPQAGAYSPFVLKLSREDGSQRLAGIDTTLPPGLTGKLAGVAACPQAQIAQAESRGNPEEGRLERESPSCPAASEVGTVDVAAGSGPTPFWTQGHAYLAGPYKGAPLSLAVITPAIAGPFDLGTVVVRIALYVDPATAQIHAVSDPLPQILDGIPLDVRTVALKMDRPGFTLNPTSCDPMAILGTATSTLGQGAGLTTPFQVGGCSALPFKPKLSLALKGSVKRSSNPRLIATLTAKEGEANVAAAQVKLPHPVFLDQSHIKTICTRVQFAADQCPAGSVYGKVEARTPLLDYPLTGAVYLRSSSHPLPDLVAKLRGPASQPIEIDLVGKTDAVNAALRNTFEAVPDAPVSSFRLELFGGKRGLVEMSGGFCRNRRAAVNLTGQNGKIHDTTPVVRAKCPKKHGKHRKHGRRR